MAYSRILSELNSVASGPGGRARRVAWLMLASLLYAWALSPALPAAESAEGPYSLHATWTEPGLFLNKVIMKAVEPRDRTSPWQVQPWIIMQKDDEPAELPLALFPSDVKPGQLTFRATVSYTVPTSKWGTSLSVYPDPRVIKQTNPKDLIADYWPMVIEQTDGKLVTTGEVELRWDWENPAWKIGNSYGPAPVLSGRFSGTIDGRPFKDSLRWEKRSLHGVPQALEWVLVATCDPPEIISPPLAGKMFRTNVINGRGAGRFSPGQTVRILADSPPRGRVFDRWISPQNVAFITPDSPATAFTMPNMDVTVEATFRERGHLLTVLQGKTTARYPAGQKVEISADSPPEGRAFDRWISPDDVAFSDVNSPLTTFTMPNRDITVEATYRDTGFPLTVVNGSRSGEYPAGALVPITADSPPQGQMFERWETADGVTFRDAAASRTTFTMPNRDVTVEATFCLEGYALTVVNGQKSGVHPAGSVVTVIADPAPPGLVFQRWVTADRITLKDDEAASTSFTMPGNPVTIEARYGPPLPSTNHLTVLSGSGDGEYPAGTRVRISADPPPEGKRFAHWRKTAGELADPKAAFTTFTMPGHDATVEAIFEVPPPTTYRLTVIGGTGSGEYARGTEVEIRAQPPPGNRQFVRWEKTGGILTDPVAPITTFIMPGHGVELRAAFEQLYTLTINNGKTTEGETEGLFLKGQPVRLVADVPPAGREFVRWTTTAGELEDPEQRRTSFFMSAEEAMVTAIYRVPPPRQYTLTVYNGQGSGQYPVGAKINIRAASPPKGKRFVGWRRSAGDLANPLEADTTFTMPDRDTAVEAAYESIYNLTLENAKTSDGRTEGQFLQGESILIVADPAPAGKRFLEWTAETGELADAGSRRTTFYMPDKATTVSAVYRIPPPRKFRLTVRNGTGSGEYAAGTRIRVEAAPPPKGKRFANWTKSAGAFTDHTVAQTAFVMPAEHTTIEPLFELPPPVRFQLTVVNGSGTGHYAAGTEVRIKADQPQRNRRFSRWHAPADLLNNSRAMETDLVMPNRDTVAKATYDTADVLLVLSDGIRMRERGKKWFSISQMSALELARDVPGYTMGICTGRNARLKEKQTPPLMKAARTGQQTKELSNALKLAGTLPNDREPQRLNQMLKALPELVKKTQLQAPHAILVTSTEWSSDRSQLDARNVALSQILRNVDYLTIIHLETDRDALRPEHENFVTGLIGKDTRIRRKLVFLEPGTDHAAAIDAALREAVTSGLAASDADTAAASR